jgi:hypothetical protein
MGLSAFGKATEAQILRCKLPASGSKALSRINLRFYRRNETEQLMQHHNLQILNLKMASPLIDDA